MGEKRSSSGKAVKAGVGYTIGNMLVKGLSFLSVILFSRLLTVAEFGEYNTYSAYTSIFFVVVGLALHSSIKNANIDYPNELNRYISSITLPVIFVTVLFGVVSLVLAKPLAGVLALAKPVLVVIIVLDSFFLAMITFYNGVLAVKYSFFEYLLISMLYAVIGIGVSVVLIFLFPEGDRYMGRILGTLISASIVTVYILFRIYRKALPSINPVYWQYGLRISLPIIPHGISQILLSQFDRLMIKATVGSDEAGLYSFAYTVAMLFSVVAASLDTAWTQWFFDQMQEGKESTVRKAANYYQGIMAVGAIMLLLISPELTVLMGGKKYSASQNVVPPVVLAMFFSFMYFLPATVEYYYKKTKFIAIGTMSAAALNILLNIIFIPRYGYAAAAYTTVVCYLFYFVLHVCFARKIHGRHLYDVRIQILYAVGVTTIAFVVLLLLKNVVVRAILFLLCLIALLFICILNRSKIRNIRKRA